MKLLNILTVMLLLTRTFAAQRAQSRQIRWRQIVSGLNSRRISVIVKAGIRIRRYSRSLKHNQL